MSAPHSSVARTSEPSLKLSTIAEILAENQSSRLLCPNDPFIPEVPKLRWIYFLPKKYRWGRTTTNSNTSLSLLPLCSFVLSFRMGKPPFSQTTCSFSNNLMSFESPAFGFVKKEKKIEWENAELPAVTTALPQEHAVGVGDSWHPKIQRERENLIFQWKANQHIWSHWMPDSRHALCCSSPNPCNSASQWQNSKTTPTAHILTAVLPTQHTSATWRSRRA